MRYLDGNTIFHRIDPRAKIVAGLVCACLVIILQEPAGLFFLFACLFAGFLLVHPPFSYVKITVTMMIIIVLTTIISQGFFYYFEPRTPVITFIPADSGFIGRLTGGIAVYKEGLSYGLVQSMRLLCAALFSMTIVLTTYPSDLVLGLTSVGLPQKIGFMIMVSIRFLPIMIDEGKRILLAQKLKGLKVKGLTGAIRGFRFLMLPLVIDSLRTARRVALAAEVRGFGEKRVPLKTLSFSAADWVVSVGSVLVLMLVIVRRYIV